MKLYNFHLETTGMLSCALTFAWPPHLEDLDENIAKIRSFTQVQLVPGAYEFWLAGRLQVS